MINEPSSGVRTTAVTSRASGDDETHSAREVLPYAPGKAARRTVSARITEPESVGAMIDGNAVDPSSEWPTPIELTLPTMDEMYYSDFALRETVKNRNFVTISF